MNHRNLDLHIKRGGVKGHCWLICLLLCVVMFCFSLSLDSLFDAARGNSMRGLDILLMGWIGIFYGMPAWYANPLLVSSLLLSRKYPFESMACALVGFLFGATALLVHQMVLDESGRPVAIRLEFGYYLWLCSFTLAFVASYIRNLEGT